MYYAAFYDAERRLLAGDQTKHLTHVGFGSSDLSPNAEVAGLTDMVTTPITRFDFVADDPRRVLVFFELAPSAGIGLVIREIGLLTADGTLVYRRTRRPIEKVGDLAYGDHFDLQA